MDGNFGTPYVSKKSIAYPDTPTGYAADANHYQRLSEQPIEIMQKLFITEQLKGFLLGREKDKSTKVFYKWHAPR